MRSRWGFFATTTVLQTAIKTKNSSNLLACTFMCGLKLERMAWIKVQG
jgi:hypothetical protein